MYVGSAKKNASSRIFRHLSKKKNKFWHIDYLLGTKVAMIKSILVKAKDQECGVAQGMLKLGFSFVPAFGSSDCQCPSHLFYTKRHSRSLQGLLRNFGFKMFVCRITKKFS